MVLADRAPPSPYRCLCRGATHQSSELGWHTIGRGSVSSRARMAARHNPLFNSGWDSTSMNETVMSIPDLGRKQYERCQVLKPVTGFRASFRRRQGAFDARYQLRGRPTKCNNITPSVNHNS